MKSFSFQGVLETFFPSLSLFVNAKNIRQPKAGNCQFSNFSVMKKRVSKQYGNTIKPWINFIVVKTERERNESNKSRSCLKMHKLTFSICKKQKPKYRHKFRSFFSFPCLNTCPQTVMKNMQVDLPEKSGRELCERFCQVEKRFSSDQWRFWVDKSLNNLMRLRSFWDFEMRT